MDFQLDKHTIFLAVAGSWAYGTNLPTSDVDLKGFGLPPKGYRTGFLRTFEQCESPQEMEVYRPSLPRVLRDAAEGQPLDGVVYELRKFFNLAAGANPNVLDTLFADEADVIVCTAEGSLVRQHRRAFLSKRIVHTFRGYAVAQIKKIERHRKWLLDPPKHKPTRVEFGLPEHHREVPPDQMGAATAAIKQLVDSWEIDFGEAPKATVLEVQEKLQEVLTQWKIGHEGKFNLAGTILGYEQNFLDLMNKERSYKQAADHWGAFQEWKAGRNAKRAEIESRFGYDCKHGMHLVRLLQSCREILETGDYSVRRPNADELIAIRNGAWSYERLMDFAKEQETDLLDVATRSALPKHPDMNRLDALCSEAVESWEARHGCLGFQ